MADMVDIIDKFEYDDISQRFRMEKREKTITFKVIVIDDIEYERDRMLSDLEGVSDGDVYFPPDSKYAQLYLRLHVLKSLGDKNWSSAEKGVAFDSFYRYIREI